ncbi:DUF5689 domain-containing protein [Ulvibacterium sp.]|uniref:DUF5689 domain-containing protein n=1 Tax=Ulvibacterium sp. TaxID=2665914 RepID=UPI0026145817|nr:DUF5689 domain-containing protein [Ulvibacterium sp.]
MKKSIALLAVISVWTTSCIKNRNFDPPRSTCVSDIAVNATFAQVKNLYVDETIQILEDWVIEGYVISSDKAGNFFSVLHFQDDPLNPTDGFQIEIDLRDSHIFYPMGSKIFIKLKGLYLGKSREVFKLGGTFISFGNVSVGRLPAAVVGNHVFVSCDEIVEPRPILVTVDAIGDAVANTLVTVENVEFLEEELGLPFATEREETERNLTTCNDNQLIMLNSGFSDFQAQALPEGNGSVTGVLVKDRDDFQLIIRDLNDIDFSGKRCENLIDEFTSTLIFISELADPDNNSGARFVELYNADSQPLSLRGWALRRYTNANTEVSSSLDLSELTIAAGSTVVISPNAEEFEIVYGFKPDLGVRTNSPADSNGDDNLELVDPFGAVIDIFGVIGEDGSGTNHEFEDGRAVRNLNIMNGNPMYTFSEWTIYNDSGEAGTIDLPQNAPEDFGPGKRD